MRFLFAILVIGILGACAEPDLESRRCTEAGETRPCTIAEEMMIDGIHTILRGVRDFDRSKLGNSFKALGSNRPKVLFFGEKHTEIIGMIETLGAINSIAQKGDRVLLEGADRRAKPAFEDCGLYMAYRIYVQWQVEKRGQAYDPEENYNWQKTQNFWTILENTKTSYDLSGLNLAYIRCGFWDNGQELRESLKRKTTTYQSMKIRNRSMVEAIEENLTDTNKIIVNTGYAHMPLGEIISHMQKNSQNKSIIETPETYYQLVKAEKKQPKTSRMLKVSDTDGSSRVIYKYLTKKGIPYLELIHGKMIY